MRQIQDRRTSKGTSYVVRFKDAARRERSETFTVRAKAAEFASLLDALGPERAIAYLDAQDPAAGPAAWTLDRWAAEYIETLTDVTDGTRHRYHSIYRRSWQPVLGTLPLGAIDKGMIARLINAQAAAGLSDKTVANNHGLLAAMLAEALDAGHLDRNPCKGLKLPRRTGHAKVRPRFLDYDEFERLYAAISAHYQPLVLFLVGTGARWGEAEALLISDLTLDAAVPAVTISKAVKWHQTGLARKVGPPKTPRGNRTVSLPPDVTAVLRPLVAGRRKTDRLFLAPRGGELRHRTFSHDIWYKAIIRAGLDPAPRIHDLRHTHVAWLIAEGIDLPVIQNRLGHESIKTTVDTYGHLLPGFQAAAAAAAGVALNRRGRPALRIVREA